MSLDQQPDLTEQGREPHRPGDRRRLGVAGAVLIALAAVVSVGLLITNVDRDPGVILETPSTAPPSAAPVTPSPPTLTEDEKVLAQYRRYDAVQDSLAAVPPAERPAVWGEVATGRVYTLGLEAAADLDKAGQVRYGQGRLNPVLASRSDRTAVVRDCYDSSASGVMRKSDGKKLTVGTPNDLLTVVMVRGPDDIWRVSEVALAPPGTAC